MKTIKYEYGERVTSDDCSMYLWSLWSVKCTMLVVYMYVVCHVAVGSAPGHLNSLILYCMVRLLTDLRNIPVGRRTKFP